MKFLVVQICLGITSWHIHLFSTSMLDHVTYLSMFASFLPLSLATLISKTHLSFIPCWVTCIRGSESSNATRRLRTSTSSRSCCHASLLTPRPPLTMIFTRTIGKGCSLCYSERGRRRQRSSKASKQQPIWDCPLFGGYSLRVFLDLPSCCRAINCSHSTIVMP